MSEQKLCDVHMSTSTHVIENHCHLAAGHEGRCIVGPRHDELLGRALRGLVAALDTCEPGIQAAFQLSQLHGQNYSGPTYEKELVEAKAILEVDDSL